MSWEDWVCGGAALAEKEEDMGASDEPELKLEPESAIIEEGEGEEASVSVVAVAKLRDVRIGSAYLNPTEDAVADGTEAVSGRNNLDNMAFRGV